MFARIAASLLLEDLEEVDFDSFRSESTELESDSNSSNSRLPLAFSFSPLTAVGIVEVFPLDFSFGADTVVQAGAAGPMGTTPVGKLLPTTGPAEGVINGISSGHAEVFPF